MAKTDETHTRGGMLTRVRSAQYATDRRGEGLTRVCVWVPEGARERIVELAAKMRAGATVHWSAAEAPTRAAPQMGSDEDTLEEITEPPEGDDDELW